MQPPELGMSRIRGALPETSDSRRTAVTAGRNDGTRPRVRTHDTRRRKTSGAAGALVKVRIAVRKPLPGGSLACLRGDFGDSSTGWRQPSTDLREELTDWERRSIDLKGTLTSSGPESTGSGLRSSDLGSALVDT